MNVENLLADAQDLSLRRAILLYEGDSRVLATVHAVYQVPDEKQPVIGPGRCLTREALDELVHKLAGTSQRRDIIPEGVLCSDSTRLAWWTPSALRPIFFNTADKEFNKAVDGKNVRYPALVFVAKPGSLSVFAIPEDARPNADTKLYRAPFMNLYDQGNMCAGDTRLPEVVLTKDIPTWERSFFDTRFTHTNIHSGKLTTFEGGHTALWKAMVRAKRFPADALLPLKKTLEEAVQ